MRFVPKSLIVLAFTLVSVTIFAVENPGPPPPNPPPPPAAPIDGVLVVLMIIGLIYAFYKFNNSSINKKSPL
jgi:hypothetical protein